MKAFRIKSGALHSPETSKIKLVLIAEDLATVLQITGKMVTDRGLVAPVLIEDMGEVIV